MKDDIFDHILEKRQESEKIVSKNTGTDSLEEFKAYMDDKQDHDKQINPVKVSAKDELQDSSDDVDSSWVKIEHTHFRRKSKSCGFRVIDVCMWIIVDFE